MIDKTYNQIDCDYHKMIDEIPTFNSLCVIVIVTVSVHAHSLPIEMLPPRLTCVGWY